MNTCVSPYRKLIFDEACLHIYNEGNDVINISRQYDECDGCNFQKSVSLAPRSNFSLIINTKYSLTVNYTNINNNNTCQFNKLFYEHYRYGWNLTEKCNPIYIKETADNAYLPILKVFIVLFIFGMLWRTIKYIHKCVKSSETLKKHFGRPREIKNDSVSLGGIPSLEIENLPPIHKQSHRVKSVDVFRGLCITLMIFVNRGGGRYWFFQHSVWNGLTIADLIFPWFLWIMGFSLIISLNNRLRKAVPRRQIFMQIFRRSVILVLLGIVLKSHGQSTVRFKSLRFPGVLQRIGVTYLIVGLMEATFAKYTVSVNKNDRLCFLQDILLAIPQWIIIFVIIFVHTATTFLLEVPGCGRGYLGPGGLHKLGHYKNCTGGAAGYIDRLVFGKHMHGTPMAQAIYKNVANFDHDGILGTLTAVFSVYLGVQAGRIFHTYNNVKARIVRWVIWGVMTALIGGILCGFTKNHGFIPINRHLWSLSLTLTTGGMAFVIYALLTVMVDVLHYWDGRPLIYPGMNAIFLYAGFELLKNKFPFAWTPDNETHAAYLYMHLWCTSLWILISIVLYKKNIFLSI
ncbi:hypothetical protein ILUMI_20323 [Ignelater luminosus]|uniref:Heparan-alpha-glucosaminide N-acetyltransferase n=1 Tax=Ignelater luminosus TaxID=2038154 RepID=A0A8K0CL46_IGNLU|nr:hypothetical protein ILUMI_20323 [Ignelater luminosus]